MHVCHCWNWLMSSQSNHRQDWWIFSWRIPVTRQWSCWWVPMHPCWGEWDIHFHNELLPTSPWHQIVGGIKSECEETIEDAIALICKSNPGGSAMFVDFDSVSGYILTGWHLHQRYPQIGPTLSCKARLWWFWCQRCSSCPCPPSSRYWINPPRNIRSRRLAERSWGRNCYAAGSAVDNCLTQEHDRWTCYQPWL